MKIVRRTLEQYYGVQLAEKAGLTPLIEQLVKLDKITALRYLVFSRRVYYNLIIYIEKANKIKPGKDISTHELITFLNSVMFSKYGYIQIKPKKNKKEFEGLLSAMQNTVITFLFDSIKLTAQMGSELRKDLEKAFNAINIVYAHFPDNSLNEDANDILGLFSIEFPEEKNSEIPVDKDESLGDVVVDDMHIENKTENDEQNSEGIPENSEDETKLLTRQEVADIFKITLPTLADWEKKGEIPKAVRIGNRVYFKHSEIINHINSKGRKADNKYA